MKSTSIILLVALATSCDLIELQQPPAVLRADDMTNSGPLSLPATRNEAEGLFAGNQGKTWQAIGFTLMGIEGMLECRIDDRITIDTNGTFLFDGGDNLCGAEDNKKNRSGEWEINENASEIIFNLDGKNYTAQITGLVEDTISLSGSYLGLEINGLYIVEK